MKKARIFVVTSTNFRALTFFAGVRKYRSSAEIGHLASNMPSSIASNPL